MGLRLKRHLGADRVFVVGGCSGVESVLDRVFMGPLFDCAVVGPSHRTHRCQTITVSSAVRCGAVDLVEP
jgi:hypothetical protein